MDFLTITDDVGANVEWLKNLSAAAEERQGKFTVSLLMAGAMLTPELAPFESVYLPETHRSDEIERAADRASALLAGAVGDVEVRVAHGDPTWLASSVLADHGLTDAIVVPGIGQWSLRWLRQIVAESLLLAAGAPLLLLPEQADLPRVRHAVFGWRESPEARRALRELIRLAERGAKIDVVTVGPVGDGDRGKSARKLAVEYLAHHGFEAEAHVRNGIGSDADALQAFCLEAGADLLAVGGFGHSRIREIFLGGVTLSLMDEPRLPVLMSH
jgi:nucleotide-binding universal stress UspA family protein